MNTHFNARLSQLMNEIELIDKDTYEIKKEIQYKGCPFCEIDNGEFIETALTKQALFFKYKKCNLCSLIYPYPRPNKQTIESFFLTNDVFLKKTEKVIKDLEKKRSLSFARRIWRKTLGPRLVYNRYREIVKSVKKGDKILDVGSGFGNCIELMLKKGCVVEAVEPNSLRAKFLREKLGIKVYENTLEKTEFQESSYDIVIFSQVIMHLFSLKNTIEKTRYILRPGGLLISSQMNFNSIVQQTIRSPYPGRIGLNPFTMCSWFTPASLSKILEKSEFKVIDIKFRPTGFWEFLFTEGYPGGLLTRFILKIMDEIIKIILMKTGTSDHFFIVAKKIKSI